MAKYINAEKLIAEIERHIKHYESSNRDDFKNGELYICQELLSFLDSLQQEMPEVDLETFDKEVTKMWRRCAADPNDTIACLHIDSFIEVARHFNELGQRKAAEMYDEIEYNRQRAEEEMLGKTLNEASAKRK